MNRRILVLLAVWVGYTYGHQIGHDRASGRRPYVGRLWRNQF